MVLEKIDFYLDINLHGEVDQITQKIHRLGKPIYSFLSTNHDQTGQNHLFEDQQVDQMIEAIRQYLKTVEK